MSGGLALAPLVPWPWVALPAALAAALLVVAAVRRSRGWAFRALAFVVLVLALLNPRAVSERRQPQRDVAVLVVDRSASQSVGARTAQTEAALKAVRAGLRRFDDLEVRLVEAPAGGPGVADAEAGTRLFAALGRAQAEVPRGRFAGALLITDGRVHDAPGPAQAAALPGPLHVLLSGAPDEADRRLVVDKAPGYGIVGAKASVVCRVEDSAGGRGTARVRLRLDGVAAGSMVVRVGRSERVTFSLEHAGPTVVELEVEAAEGELSTINNRAAVSVNGVRDRLRVLLVSGQPHAGERTWRNLLKSDPSVDLVHFTILRPPEKDDLTPLRELSLIAFPIRELFEVKIDEFDLIVFDRYVVRDVLPPSYMRNIGEYVRRGGALLVAVGPEFAGLRSLFNTPLGKVMPGRPTGRVVEGGFHPALTGAGRRHPVTAALLAGASGGPPWGRWFRQIEVAARAGVALMEGTDGAPLLLLDRVGEGRVAQFMSDHIWLWARGFEGGGPHAELVRRLAHWLMKEPDLEEEALSARIVDGRLAIERRSLDSALPPATVTTPSGASRTVQLEAAEGGAARATLPANEAGLYRVEDGALVALAAAGALNPLEYADLRASAEPLASIAAASGGGIAWIGDGPLPELRRTRPGGDSAGRGWMGLRRNGAYVVTGLDQVPLLPGLVVLGLVLAALFAAWQREAK